MFQKWNQRSRHRNDLFGRHINVVNLAGIRGHEFILMTAGHQLVSQIALCIHRGIGLGNGIRALLDSRQVLHLVHHPAALNLAVRCLQETVIIGACVYGKGIDETDIRPFRGLDRAHPAIVRGMHIAHFKPGTLTRQTTRAQSRHPALVGHLRQGIVLIHELGQLTGAKEFLDRGSDRFGVNQLLRHQAFRFRQAEALPHRTFHAHQADTEYIFRHLTHTADTTVTKVVDIIHRAVTVADIDQHLHDFQDVFF